MKIKSLILTIILLCGCQKEHQNNSNNSAQGNEIGFGGYGLLKNESLELLDLVLNPTIENSNINEADPKLMDRVQNALGLRAHPKAINLDFIKSFTLKLQELDTFYRNSLIDIDRKLVGNKNTTTFSELLLSVMENDFRWLFADGEVAAAQDYNPQLKDKIESHFGFKITNEELIPLAYRTENKIVISIPRFNQLFDSNHRAALIFHEAFSSLSELIIRRKFGDSVQNQKIYISLQAADLVSYAFSKDLEQKGTSGFVKNFWLKLLGESKSDQILERDKKWQNLQGKMIHVEEGSGFDLRIHSTVIPFEIALPSKSPEDGTRKNSIDASISKLPLVDPCKTLGNDWFLPQDSLMQRLVLHKYFDLTPQSISHRARFSFSPFLLVKSQEDGSDHDPDFSKLNRVENHWSGLMFNSSSLNVIPLMSRGNSMRLNTPRSYWSRSEVSDQETSDTALIQARQNFALMCARYEEKNGLIRVTDAKNRQWKYLGEFKGSDESIDRCNAHMGKEWRLATPKEYLEAKEDLLKAWSAEDSKIDWGLASETVALRSEASLQKSLDKVHEMYAAIGSYINTYKIIKAFQASKLPKKYSRSTDGTFEARDSEEAKAHTPSMLHICISQ